MFDDIYCRFLDHNTLARGSPEDRLALLSQEELDGLDNLVSVKMQQASENLLDTPSLYTELRHRKCRSAQLRRPTTGLSVLRRSAGIRLPLDCRLGRRQRRLRVPGVRRYRVCSFAGIKNTLLFVFILIGHSGREI
jgi:hypothetical protein